MKTCPGLDFQIQQYARQVHVCRGRITDYWLHILHTASFASFSESDYFGMGVRPLQGPRRTRTRGGNVWSTNGTGKQQTATCSNKRVRVVLRRKLSDRKFLSSLLRHYDYIHTSYIWKSGHSGKMRRTERVENNFDDRQAENLAEFHKNRATVSIFTRDNTIRTYSCTQETSPVAAKTYASNRYRSACCPRETVRTAENGDRRKKIPYKCSKISLYPYAFLRNILYNFKYRAFLLSLPWAQKAYIRRVIPYKLQCSGQR